jgi:hypothetical protein
METTRQLAIRSAIGHIEQLAKAWMFFSIGYAVFLLAQHFFR